MSRKPESIDGLPPPNAPPWGASWPRDLSHSKVPQGPFPAVTHGHWEVMALSAKVLNACPFFVHVCVHIYRSVYICVKYMCVPVFIYMPEVNSGCHSPGTVYLFLKDQLSLAWNLPNWFDCLTSEPQGPAFLFLPSSGIMSTYYHAQIHLPTWILGVLI